MQTFLAEIPPYDTLDEAALQSLASITVTRHYRKNHVIIYQGDDTNSMFILCQGEMRVYVEDENGRQLTVRMLKPGDSLGEVALIGDFPRTASVVTLTPCTVASFTRANYLAFLKKHPDLLLALARSLAVMVRETTEELGSIALSDVCGRLRHILEKYAVENDNKRQLPRFTHREIAGMIGSSREMVSKSLKELENNGFISVTADHYVLEKPLPDTWQ